jgi:acetyl esterase/lipase
MLPSFCKKRQVKTLEAEFVADDGNSFGGLQMDLNMMSTHFNFKADAATADSTSCRPDFAILIYPVISFDSTITHKGSRNNLVGSNATEEKIRYFSNELQVNAQTPPSFLVHAGDDGAVPVDNSIRYYRACIKNKVPAELHLYPKGGHGFGLYNKTTNDHWPERLRNWLQSLK